MAGYINPSTEVRILSVPWDEDMTNTMWWSYYSEQENFMLSRTGKEFPINTYQRIEPGVFRAAIDADDLYGYNYIMFRNREFPSSKYGEKWFYAFITQVDYVNDGMSNIHFKIDPIQTWFFEAFGDDGESNIPTCWVKRIHQSTDEAGDNIQPEPVQLGDYNYEKQNICTFNKDGLNYGISSVPYTNLQPYAIMIMVCDMDTSWFSGTNVAGRSYEGVYSGATLWCCPMLGTSDNLYSYVDYVNEFLDKFVKKPEAVIGIYMCPYLFVDNITEEQEYPVANPSDADKPDTTGIYEVEQSRNNSVHYTELTAASFDDTEKFGSYTPKNKKCYTYPYYFCSVFAPDGRSIIMRYEFCYNDYPELCLVSTCLYPVSCTLRPVAYEMEDDSLYYVDQRFNQQLTIESFPQCSWNTDAFANWFARSAIPTAITAGTNMITTGLSNVGNPAKMSEALINQGIKDIGAIATDTYTASIAADIYKGNLEPGSADMSCRTAEFYYAKTKQPEDYIRYIDNYFTRYGYAQNKLMKPNMQARKYWTYVRTSDMDINAEIPADAKKEIDNVFNTGFTAWNYDYISTNISNYGDYSLDNTTLG